MISYRETSAADLISISVLSKELNQNHHLTWSHIFASGAGVERVEEFCKKGIGAPTATAFVAKEVTQSSLLPRLL